MKPYKSQKEMFLDIWDQRPHVSQLSGRNLLPKGHPMWHWQFLHVLPKGKYKKYALNPDNILLALPEEHNKQETFSVFNEMFERLHRQYYAEIHGREYEGR